MEKARSHLKAGFHNAKLTFNHNKGRSHNKTTTGQEETSHEARGKGAQPPGAKGRQLEAGGTRGQGNVRHRAGMGLTY